MDKAKHKILIIDDDEFLLDMYATKFKEEGFEVETAREGKEALDKIKEGANPEIVLLDVVMPGMDGFQMLRSLQRPGSGFESLVIVVVSALDSDAIKARGGLPQGVVFCQKPVDYTHLESLVRLQFLKKNKPAKNLN